MKKRFQSFSFAFDGFVTMIREEPNARIHLVATAVTVILGWYVDLSSTEWLAVVIAIGMVLSAEAFNSAIENVSDGITTEYNPHIRKAKDIAAAAVLISTCTAALIGMIVFIPKLWELIN